MVKKEEESATGWGGRGSSSKSRDRVTRRPFAVLVDDGLSLACGWHVTGMWLGELTCHWVLRTVCAWGLGGARWS